MSELSELLRKNLLEICRDREVCLKTATSGPLFFSSDNYAQTYADIFGIDSESWFETFRIVTEGQGGELKKINSLISSSLLSLLVFHRLYKSNTDNNIKVRLPGNTDDDELIKFDKCFFEVRNHVISPNCPSCVDVVLYSTESKKMLFLESKFTEYCVIDDKKEYGKSYIDLYRKYLNTYLDKYLEIEDRKDKLVINARQQKEYIEGIKQSISHLIGILKGPSKRGKGYYPDEYADEYADLYHNSTAELYYGTILYDPSGLMVDDSLYKNYKALYVNTIGRHGQQIVEGIRKWNKATSKNFDKEKNIVILESPLTYQSLLTDNPQYKNLLPENVKKFYNF